MTLQQQPASADMENERQRPNQDDRLMETLHMLADGSASTRGMLSNLLAQYSWDGYINELEFE